MTRGFRRREFIRSLCATASVFTLDQLLSGTQADAQFVNVAREAGLRSKTIFGRENKNRFLLETTGCGVAFYDYDHDGWLDIFLVNGTRFDANWTKADAPVSRLYKNNRDGTFTDVTLKAGLARTGWGQGCCIGDYDNDGLDDLLVTYWGDCVLYRNNGDGTFSDVSEKTGVAKTTRVTAAGLTAGTPAAPLSTTIGTAGSTSSSVTISTSTRRRCRCPRTVIVSTKA